MNDLDKEKLKSQNSQISVWLIILNIFLILIYLNYGYQTENEEYENILFGTIGFLVLLAGFAFTYHGKGYRIGKWIFGIVLIITLLLVAMAVYVTGLAAAFQH